MDVAIKFKTLISKLSNVSLNNFCLDSNSSWLVLLSFIVISNHLNAQWTYVGSEITPKQKNIENVIVDKQGSIYAYRIQDSVFYKYNGSSWSEIKVSSMFSNIKTARIYLMYYDSTSNQLYLHGYLVDVNSSIKKFLSYYDGTQWNQVPGFSSLFASSASFISNMCKDKLGNLYLANLNNNSNNAMVAKFDGSNWSELGGNNALIGYGSLNAICADNLGNIYTSGISNPPYYVPFILKHNGATWSKMPSVFYGEDTAYSFQEIQLQTNSKGALYAFRSYRDNLYNQFNYLVRYDGQKWDEQTVNSPWSNNTFMPSRFSIDMYNNIYLYGKSGFNSQGNYFNIFKLSGNSWFELKENRNTSCDIFSIIESVALDQKGSLYAVGSLYNSNCYPVLAKHSSAQYVSIKDKLDITSNFSIYPNPTNSKIKFKLDATTNQKFNLSLINALGQIVFEINDTDLKDDIDASALNNGIYFVKIQNQHSQKTFRIIKE